MAYATVAQLIDGWRPLEDWEKQQAEELLERASCKIDAAADVSKMSAAHLACVPYVCCDIVRRCMQNGNNNVQYGKNFDEDEVWESITPTGDLWLSDENKRDLGIGHGRFAYVSMI